MVREIVMNLRPHIFIASRSEEGDLLAEKLRPYGRVEIARADAPARLAQVRPQTIVIDIRLPDEERSALLDAVRVPSVILAFIGSGPDEKLEAFVDASNATLLTHPFDEDLLKGIGEATKIMHRRHLTKTDDGSKKVERVIKQWQSTYGLSKVQCVFLAAMATGDVDPSASDDFVSTEAEPGTPLAEAIALQKDLVAKLGAPSEEIVDRLYAQAFAEA